MYNSNVIYNDYNYGFRWFVREMSRKLHIFWETSHMYVKGGVSKVTALDAREFPRNEPVYINYKSN